MSRCWLALVVCFLAYAQSQEQLPPETVQRLDDFIQELMTNHSVPAFGLSVVKLGNDSSEEILLHTKGYGFQDIENQVPSHEATLYVIASITKSFTATLVAKTLNEMFPELGEDVLNTPIRQLAPAFNFTLRDRYRSDYVTFKDLLSHRVCIFPDFLGWMYQTFTNESDVLYRQRYAPEVCSLRTGYWYNDGMYGMAGSIIASMKGSTYEDMLQEFLFDLGMNETTWVKSTDDHNEMANRSVPYYFKDGTLHRLNTELLKGASVLTAGAGLISSPKDMLKYLQFHLNLGKVDDRQLIPEEAMAWLHKPSNPLGYGVVKTGEDPDATLDYMTGYALGFEITAYDGFRRVGHGGYAPPYESYISLYPELGLGVFTAMSGPGTLIRAPTNILHNGLFNILRGMQVPKVPFQAVDKNSYDTMYRSTRKTHAIPRINPEDVVGVYGSGLSGYMSITLRANDTGGLQAYMLFGKFGTGWLEQVAGNIFTIKWDSDVWQLHWIFQSEPIIHSIYFVDQDSLVLKDNDIEMSDVFVRGVRLDDLPVIPWAPGSCSAPK